MSIFSDNDLRLLNKTLEIREKIVDHLLTKELPTKAKDIDSLTNLLESIDRSVLGKAKIKVEDSVAKANEETKEILRSMLLDLHKNNIVNESTISKEPPKFESNGMNVRDEETIIGIDKIDIKEILNNE